MRGGGVAASSRRRSSGGPETLVGNFQTYGKNPWGAYTGMWGMNNPQAPGLVASSSMTVTPTTFPNGTVFNWNVTPSPSWNGVNGYLYVSYGNYDGSPGQITPQQVKNITALTINSSWSFSGDPSSGLLSECWLSPTATPSGGVSKLFEIAFFPKFSTPSRNWLDTLPLIGTGFTVNGVNFSVRLAAGSVPYIIAYRSDYADIQGDLPYKNFFSYLIAQGQITGNEWFNGVSFGVEPFSGTASLTINTLAATYS